MPNRYDYWSEWGKVGYCPTLIYKILLCLLLSTIKIEKISIRWDTILLLVQFNGFLSHMIFHPTSATTHTHTPHTHIRTTTVRLLKQSMKSTSPSGCRSTVPLSSCHVQSSVASKVVTSKALLCPKLPHPRGHKQPTSSMQCFMG
jgi:hypothetical protein